MLIVKKRRESAYEYRQSIITANVEESNVEMTQYKSMDGQERNSGVSQYGSIPKEVRGSVAERDGWEITPSELEFGEQIGRGGFVMNELCNTLKLMELFLKGFGENLQLQSNRSSLKTSPKIR